MSNKNIQLQLLLVSLLCAISSLHAEKEPTTFTYHTRQSSKDIRFSYDQDLIKLALEKTVEEYGPYKLVPMPEATNYKRILSVAKSGTVKNLIFKHSVSKELLEEFGYISFPVDRGIVGYRVAFVSKETKEKVSKIQTIEELKKLSIIQGLGWLDTTILRHHGFTVQESSSFGGIFKMVAYNRGDLFLRGANEIHKEWLLHKEIPNLTYDTSLLIYYPLPRFFFSAKENTHALTRIAKGLNKAYIDGSLVKLWEHHYRESIEFVEFKKRKVFKLTNPLIKTINKSYERFIYDPSK